MNFKFGIVISFIWKILNKLKKGQTLAGLEPFEVYVKCWNEIKKMFGEIN
jgi:hypothetical protein